MARFRKSSSAKKEFFDQRHRFEHWYRDNTVYFITSRCRDQFHAFKTDEAAQVFWDRFEHYRALFEFVPWIVTLMSNHYHILGYLRIGVNLGPMMQRLHGSVAKLVNDTLPARHVPFWRAGSEGDYFDGCLRDELQCRRVYRYTYLQSVRAGLVRDAKDYPHTRVYVDLDKGVKRALELKAFLEEVPYKRFERG